MPTRSVTALTAAALSVLLAPAAQAAPVLAPLKPCYVSVGVNPSTGQAITENIDIKASGFTPGALVDVQVDGVTAASGVPADATGAISGTVKAPLQERGDRQFGVVVTEQNNPANTVEAAARVTTLSVSVQPKQARPTSRITFRGRGFTDGGKTVWAHYVKGGRHKKTVKLGVPDGPCGVFAVKRKQFPFRPSTGTWRLQIDQQKRYSAKPNSVYVRLEIFVRRVFRRRG